MAENAEQIAYNRIKTAIFKRYIREGRKLAEASGVEDMIKSVYGLGYRFEG